jgi:hypothetical protein
VALGEQLFAPDIRFFVHKVVMGEADEGVVEGQRVLLEGRRVHVRQIIGDAGHPDFIG